MELTKFKSELSFGNKLLRLIWGFVWLFLFLPSPRVFHGWRRFLLRLFGGKVGKNVRFYNTAKVYYPPNLILEDNAIVGPHVDVYCVAPVTIKSNAMISQYTYLCAASHDYRKPNLPLIALPVIIGERTWVCARSFVGPGVTVGADVVVAACAVVVKNVEPGTIVGGNPAKFIKNREPSVAE